LLSACLLTLGLTEAVRAQADKALERKELDQRLYTVLRDVINTGADLYNPPAGDRAACYRLYQGALLTARPLLDHRPELQKAIDAGLAEAAREPTPGLRAYALRRVLDQIRADVKPDDASSLWDRLGGEKGVTRVVEDFVGLAAADKAVNFFRDGKYKLDAKQVEDLKRKLVEMISEASGGPLKYSGKSMKEVHKGMGITDAEFDALAADLKAALEKNNVKPDDAAAVLKAVEATHKDIVEKKEEKKGDKGTLVSGVVTLDGKPLADAVVRFVPEAATADDYSGSTNADGKYVLSGVKPGKYAVSISKRKNKEDPASELLPARYNAQSSLRVEVPQAESVLDFALKTK
jgi:hemoglobin